MYKGVVYKKARLQSMLFNTETGRVMFVGFDGPLLLPPAEDITEKDDGKLFTVINHGVYEDDCNRR